MIVNLLAIGFFGLLWLMAAKGLIEASGPFMRRLSLWGSRPATGKRTPLNRLMPATQS